jgi:hypothetical protein
MESGTRVWKPGSGWTAPVGNLTDEGGAHLVLAFGSPACFRDPEVLASVHARHPGASVLGCSTVGEIQGARVLDDSLVATAVRFERARVRTAESDIAGPADSFAVGARLAAALPGEGLAHVFVLSDGLHVNGSELAAGLASALPPGVNVTGGLAGDADRFAETLVHAGGISAPHRVGVVGFYGEGLRVGYGSMGGWEAFGPERRVTRAQGNVLYELDGRSALDLYKQYLGPHAERLPASALLFPLSVRRGPGHESLVRTVLAVDEAEHSMTFAGDVPEGWTVRLMRTNFDNLVDGASTAATACVEGGGPAAQLAVFISCVGRKLVLKQRIEEELDAAIHVLGPAATTTGFYSYGELAPFGRGQSCALHNQTMTVTTFAEA